MSEADDDGSRGFWTIAEGQAGAITNRQLRADGLTVKQIKVLLRRRVLRATSARGVYRIAGAERTPRQDLWTALLAGPDGTLASHLSAAALLGLVPPPAVPHVTVPRGASGKFDGAVVHHARVSPADRAVHAGIGSTAAGRTIVDCAAILTQRALNEMVDAAFGKQLCSYGRVMEVRRRAGPVRGGALLASALAPYAGGAEPGSVKAAHVLRRISDWGFPPPICEHTIRDAHGGFVARVDFIWLPWWLVLEYDGDGFHGPRRWGIDDRVQAQIETLGYRVERADRFDLRPSSTRLFDLLSAVLLQPPSGPWPARRVPGSGLAA